MCFSESWGFFVVVFVSVFFFPEILLGGELPNHTVGFLLSEGTSVVMFIIMSPTKYMPLVPIRVPFKNVILPCLLCTIYDTLSLLICDTALVQFLYF